MSSRPEGNEAKAPETSGRRRIRFVARGQVQGVGFRPFVFSLAREHSLTGLVRNSPRGVVIETQGKPEHLAAFAHDLAHRLPPLARLTGLEQEECAPVAGETDFLIGRSSEGDSHAVLISPDVGMCPDCRADMADPSNRRFRYPFTNCTNCGPRYSITRSIPYDRRTTSMACFPLCPTCKAEYENPLDRRFHAQPNACPECGPQVWLVPGGETTDGSPSLPPDVAAALRQIASLGATTALRQPGGGHVSQPVPPDAATAAAGTGSAGINTASAGIDRASDGVAAANVGAETANAGAETAAPCAFLRGEAALRALADLLARGCIAAVKGLGGFHLACDAGNDQALARLRQRKNRPHKPFAVMPATLEDARRIARIGPEEEALLTSPAHPVVICPLLPHAPDKAISSLVSPDTASIGLMLPYTPLHQTLLDAFADAVGQRRATRDEKRPAALVMTSGNPGGEPICLGNREALANLGSMADVFLFHNRDILIRVDDSVVRPLAGRGTLFYRRARGYVPRPISLAPPDAVPAARDVPPVARGMLFATPDAPPVAPDAPPVAPDAPPATPDAPPVARGALSATPDAPSVALREAERTAAFPVVLGVGAELKNTLCLTKDGDAFVGQHIGDMSTVDTAAFHQEIRTHLSNLLKVRPQAVVRDLHPGYLSGELAERLASENALPLLGLQHHFAHAHAVLAEHRHQGPALVLALDGTGLGEDGTLWGGEILYVDTAETAGPVHRRLAHLAPLALPGGEAAIREPWRIAHALLLRLGLLHADAVQEADAIQTANAARAASSACTADAAQTAKSAQAADAARTGEDAFPRVAFSPAVAGQLSPPWLPEYADAARLLPRMLEKGINTPWSTSCGRWFDAVSAVLGLCNATSYEGQAAVRLEEAQCLWDSAYDEEAPRRRYPCPLESAPGASLLSIPASLPFDSSASFSPFLAPSAHASPFFASSASTSPAPVLSACNPLPLRLDSLSLFAALCADKLAGTPVPVIARRFHASLALGLADAAAHLAAALGIRHVGLSGGCLQNITLHLSLLEALEERNLIPLPHKEMPPGDGCISLGQAAWGVLKLRSGSGA